MTRTRFFSIAFLGCQILALITALGTQIPQGTTWYDWAVGGFVAWGVNWVLDTFGAAP